MCRLTLWDITVFLLHIYIHDLLFFLSLLLCQGDFQRICIPWNSLMIFHNFCLRFINSEIANGITMSQRVLINSSPPSTAYMSVNRISIGSDNGLLPIWCQAIIKTNAGLLSIGPYGTNFRGILIKKQNFSFIKMHFKMSAVKWQPFCPGGDELINASKFVQCITIILQWSM